MPQDPAGPSPTCGFPCCGVMSPAVSATGPPKTLLRFIAWPSGFATGLAAAARAPAVVAMPLWVPAGLRDHCHHSTAVQLPQHHAVQHGLQRHWNSSWHRRRYQQSREPACCGRAITKCKQHPSLRRSYASSTARKGHLGLSGGSSRRRLLSAMPLPAQSPAATAWCGPASAMQALTVCPLLRRSSVCPLLRRSSCRATQCLTETSGSGSG
jgi:hypothetical protein